MILATSQYFCKVSSKTKQKAPTSHEQHKIDWRSVKKGRMISLANGNEESVNLLLFSEIRLSFYVETQFSKLFLLTAVP